MGVRATTGIFILWTFLCALLPAQDRNSTAKDVCHFIPLIERAPEFRPQAAAFTGELQRRAFGISPDLETNDAELIKHGISRARDLMQQKGIHSGKIQDGFIPLEDAETMRVGKLLHLAVGASGQKAPALSAEEKALAAAYERTLEGQKKIEPGLNNLKCADDRLIDSIENLELPHLLADLMTHQEKYLPFMSSVTEDRPGKRTDTRNDRAAIIIPGVARITLEGTLDKDKGGMEISEAEIYDSRDGRFKVMERVQINGKDDWEEKTKNKDGSKLPDCKSCHNGETGRLEGFSWYDDHPISADFQFR